MIGQHIGVVDGQSAASRQITALQPVPHEMSALPPQHKPPLQSSLPSQVAPKPAQSAVVAMHDSPLTTSAQHFCAPVQIAEPHATPFAIPDGASGMFEPLPAQLPLTHA
jgi:hypothetical protein